MPPVTQPVPVEGEIRLGQFLKLAGAADSGADARTLLLEGEVTVNGEAEARRGRRLVAGDLVRVDLVDGPLTYRVEPPPA
ncbi:MAG TPA: RNA-binding S4 domain-containing protein [Actinotalea sp.]|nr:RNA-binding S4 domain-containing protein [Actinotalea sp.]